MHKAHTLPITAAHVIVTCPGRNFVTLKLQTARGIYGIGDATLNGRELAVMLTRSRIFGSFCIAARTGGVGR
jgi:L-alanine-DL-glutamate epimerase-like enolase superfamily enzyme